ncbi:GTP-binding protein TypA/BipA [Sporotomaculum syntrophicum]|uniref:Large ribosomal subunit assembly factor BipA n=1 Tax=Sporotomaculum syntrophicum TaxID=182264 RepID=A0A9D3AZU6_9FIRM|nr:translational GTPase TypA [Sporotomaculum syntrophicum]KAF1086233.1 GTP-binding protein TypA/BipA [Sporotomaculum syntrophicum]
MDKNTIRNLAIIAHVDHGKTTLVDGMLKQSGVFHEKQVVEERVMDRNDLERERGITIMAKNTAVQYGQYKLNIVDTPGHADFGGEVERIVQMVDGVLLLVDAFEGPMPQTRFVLRKALEAGLAPIVVINKIDRLHARPKEVIDEVLDLFIELEASDAQLEFPVIFTNARAGTATLDPGTPGTDLKPLFDMIVDRIPAPVGNPQAPLQLGVTLIDYDTYVGRQAVGRIQNGTIRLKQDVAVIKSNDEIKRQRVSGLFVFGGLKKVPVEEATTGDIVVVTGLEDINVGNTIADPENPVPLSFISIDEPTVAIAFHVNKSPFAGREGTYVTSRKLGERLFREMESDVSLRVTASETPDTFLVSGRGELHLSILIENLRREGYEFEISRPQVVERFINGVRCEPVEELTLDIREDYVGIVMEGLGPRKSEIVNIQHKDNGQVRLVFYIPTRGLFGYRSEFMTDTKGLGIMHHAFHHYAPYQGEILTRTRGSLVAFETGDSTAYGLENAQERGELFIGPGVPIYRGMVVGENSRPGDLVINVCKKKQLTNMRSSTSEISSKLTPHRLMSLEQCMEFIADDELLEVTPKSLRMRKQSL